MATCIKCSATAKHDPVGGVMTACGRHSKAHAERMRRLHADPEFAKAHAERMRRLNADPEFARANAERMRKRNADPEFAKANAERMRRLNADPEFNPLVALTPEERADYDILRKAGYTRAEAFAAMGRTL